MKINNLNSYWIANDSNYLQRYNVDLSNISNHGFEYFTLLTNNFVKENFTLNSLVDRMFYQGIMKLNSLNNDLFSTDTIIKGLFKENFILEEMMFSEEKQLVQLINDNDPRASSALKQKILETNGSLSNSINLAIQGDINNLNATFSDANRKWNEWSIFIGFTGSGDAVVPIIQFGSSSFSINVAIPIVGDIPVIVLPSF
jgi:hypothetical protein